MKKRLGVKNKKIKILVGEEKKDARKDFFELLKRATKEKKK